MKIVHEEQVFLVAMFITHALMEFILAAEPTVIFRAHFSLKIIVSD